MDNFDLRKYLAEDRLLKEEVDYSSIKGEMKKIYDIDVDLDTIKDFVTSYNDSEGMDVFDTTEREDFYLYLKDEGKLLKENMSLEVDDDYIELSADSGDYTGDLNDDGTIDFSVVYDYFEEGFEDFDEYNWKDILGPKHAFVQISNQIPTKVEAVADYVMITVDLEELKNLIK